MSERWAVYFAPPPGSRLEALANQWLGRDLDGCPLPQPTVAGLTAERLAALTEAPRRYGFHATLKPPFALADGTDVAGLRAAAEAFAGTQAPFLLPPLRVATLGRFIALTPSTSCPAMDDLAAAAVRAFEPFRAPPPPEDAVRRRAGGLTARQEALLSQWGYPYVLDEFRFHMTLTGPIAEDTERSALETDLERRFADVCGDPMRVDAVALYAQPERSAPFTLRSRLPFGGV